MIQRLLPKFLKELEDPRYFQILYLGCFLTYGVGFLGWDAHLEYYLALGITALLTQLLFCKIFNKPFSSMKSAMITTLGLSILLHVSNPWVGVLAGFIGIASKFLIKWNGKHIFNPANIAIVLSILISQQAWVSPGQWGSNVLLWFMIGAAGLMMILRVGRLDTTMAFLGSFALLSFAYNIFYLGWEAEVWMHKMSNGTLLLFAFFMITDPRTTPNHSKARAIWGIMLGLCLFIASSFMYVQTAAIWILFIISPLTPFFDSIFTAKEFQWKTQNQSI